MQTKLTHTGESRRGRVLALLCLVYFLVILDAAIVRLALPSIHLALGLSPASQTWVANAYMLSFGTLLLLGGRLADLLGRRRVLLAGVGVFTLASLACGLASSGAMLIAARAAAGPRRRRDDAGRFVDPDAQLPGGRRAQPSDRRMGRDRRNRCDRGLDHRRPADRWPRLAMGVLDQHSRRSRDRRNGRRAVGRESRRRRDTQLRRCRRAVGDRRSGRARVRACRSAHRRLDLRSDGGAVRDVTGIVRHFRGDRATREGAARTAPDRRLTDAARGQPRIGSDRRLDLRDGVHRLALRPGGAGLLGAEVRRRRGGIAYRRGDRGRDRASARDPARRASGLSRRDRRTGGRLRAPRPPSRPRQLRDRPTPRFRAVRRATRSRVHGVLGRDPDRGRQPRRGIGVGTEQHLRAGRRCDRHRAHGDHRDRAYRGSSPRRRRPPVRARPRDSARVRDRDRISRPWPDRLAVLAAAISLRSRDRTAPGPQPRRRQASK